ncbi:MAG: glycosyltransferase [Cyanobacteria bacterium MAG IRC4_bin_6]|nr:glycosyltransferase [Cyanobacteria bacterium MAG IRC4_bin_6]
MGQRDLTVVLATYNEVEAVGPMVRQLLSQLDGEGGLLREVIVVDDDSPDGTADVVRQLGRQDPRIHLLLRCDRSGLASAIRDGLLSASGELAAVMDADGQHDPAVIHTAVTLLEQQEFDLVVASRFPADSGGGVTRRGLQGFRQNANPVQSVPTGWPGAVCRQFMGI